MNTLKNALLIDLQYIPNINWILNSIKYKNIKILLSDDSQKMSFRNKCYVVGSNGLINLSIPLKGGRDKKQKVKDVKINNDYKWQLLHWKTIQSCYKKAAYFEYFEHVFQPFYQNHFEYLFDYNYKMISKIFIFCKLDINIKLEESKIIMDENEFCDLRNSITPKNYLNTEYYKYTQAFEEKIGFFPNVSCIDLLMNDGLNFVKEIPFSKASKQ